jgi:hypothetical protein
MDSAGRTIFRTGDLVGFEGLPPRTDGPTQTYAKVGMTFVTESEVREDFNRSRHPRPGMVVGRQDDRQYPSRAGLPDWRSAGAPPMHQPSVGRHAYWIFRIRHTHVWMKIANAKAPAVGPRS